MGKIKRLFKEVFLIPHRCSRCGGNLYRDDGDKNYVYLEKKRSYEYVCLDCFRLKNSRNGKKISRVIKTKYGGSVKRRTSRIKKKGDK